MIQAGKSKLCDEMKMWIASELDIDELKTIDWLNHKRRAFSRVFSWDRFKKNFQMGNTGHAKKTL